MNNKRATGIVVMFAVFFVLQNRAMESFNAHNAKLICGKALYNKMEVQFEVVGFKTLLAKVLNQMHRVDEYSVNVLTDGDVQRLLSTDDLEFSPALQGKLYSIFNSVFFKAQKKIRMLNMVKEVAQYKSNYPYNYNFAAWKKLESVPEDQLDKIPDYVENLDLEALLSINIE